MASHSQKTSFREDNGSQDVLGFNNTISIDQSNILEHLGHTKAKARRQTWTSKPGDNQSPRSFLAPRVRNIQRLSKYLSLQKDFVKELFLGVLTLHYSAEACYRLQEKDSQTVDQLVAELEASW